MKKIIILFILTIFSTNSFAAGSDSNSASKVKSNYDKAVTLIKAAKKYEKKGKIEKANKRYEKAQALLIKSNKKNIVDKINYRFFGDFYTIVFLLFTGLFDLVFCNISQVLGLIKASLYMRIVGKTRKKHPIKNTVELFKIHSRL